MPHNWGTNEIQPAHKGEDIKNIKNYIWFSYGKALWIYMEAMLSTCVEKNGERAYGQTSFFKTS